jgi:DNA-binding NtrC family response regulator
MALFGRRRYGAVLSDMGRWENGVKVSDAGMRLLKMVREINATVPVVIYTTHGAASAFDKRRAMRGPRRSPPRRPS